MYLKAAGRNIFFFKCKIILANNLTIYHWLASKPWIPSSFANARAFNWHILVDTAHLNCCVLLTHL
jgi:hypothetical protein